MAVCYIYQYCCESTMMMVVATAAETFMIKYTHPVPKFVGPVPKFEYPVVSVSCGRESCFVFTPKNEYSLLTVEGRKCVCLIYRPGPYRAVNTLLHDYKNQSVNVV
jgi:hypothetical protein